MDALDVGLFSAALAGLISFASPCVLPLAIPYLAWIGAISLADTTGDARARSRSRLTALALTAAFVAGFVSMFVALGVAAALVGNWVAEWQRPAAVIAGAVLVVLGLHVARVVRIPAFDLEARFRPGARPTGPLGAYVVGVAFAFGWSPCVGPILAAILARAGAQDSLARGAMLLGVYGLGMGVPFLFGAALTGSFRRLAGHARRHMRVIEWTSAGFIVATGVLIMTGQFWRIGLWMIEVLPVFARLG
jgi:cytochrome c-type biogenesis protein